MQTLKQPNDYIIFSLDVPSLNDAKHFIAMLSDHVGMFKVGLELFIRSGPEVIRYIHSTGSARVFLDLKLHDIPATVSRAMSGIADLGVTFATVHCGENHAMLKAAVEGGQGKVSVLGVTVLTSVSRDDIRHSGFKDMFVADISLLALKRAARAKAAGCAGVVCSGLEVEKIKGTLGLDFLAVTPGIRPVSSLISRPAVGDDQARVTTPGRAIQLGADYLVIGRPIRDAKNPVSVARSIAREIRTVLNSSV